MVKIIETNLSLDNENNIRDFQSRVIEAESWDSFIDEIKNGKTVLRNSILGSMSGCTLPRQSKIEELIYDDRHLSCNVINYAEQKTKKLAYLIL